jgi:hypothetical protein
MGWPGFQTVSQLIAEVERLHLDRDDIEHAYSFARDKAKAREREAVVAWLREQAVDWEELGADACLHEADAIERGEHRREEKP